MPSFNKDLVKSIHQKKNFDILGSAHNLKEIKIKEKQKVQSIFISSLFKKNKNYLGLNKFKIISRYTKKKIVALGGVSKNNLKKIELINNMTVEDCLDVINKKNKSTDKKEKSKETNKKPKKK